MQTFISKYRETDDQAQRYLQDLKSMLQEEQTNNNRDSSKNVRIDKFPTQPLDINHASIEAKKKFSNPLSVQQNQNFQSNNQRTFDINDFFPNNPTQVPSQGPYSQREMPFQTERANHKVGAHNPMKEMHNPEITIQKMQQELRGNQNYKPNPMNPTFEIPQLNNVIPSQRIQSVQPQQKIQYQQQRQPTNSWENFQQSQPAIQVPRLNPNGQVYVNAPVNNVEYAFPNPLGFNQMNLMAYNNQLGFEPQAIPTFQPQEFQVYVINPEYQINQSQQQVYLVSQSPQLGFWQPTNQPQQAIFDNSQPVRTILQPGQIAQPIGNSHQQFAQTQLMPQNLQNLHFIPPLQAPQNHQSNNYIQQGNQLNSYKTQPQPARSEVSQKQVQPQPQSQSQAQYQHHQQHHQQKQQQQQQQQQKQMKQVTQHPSVHEESKLGHYQQQVSHKQAQQMQKPELKPEPKPEPKSSKQQNQVEGLFCIPAFPGVSHLEKVQPKVDNALISEERIKAEFLKQLEIAMQQDSDLSHLESLMQSNLIEQQIKVNQTGPKVQPFHIERNVKTQRGVVEKEKEKEKENEKEEEKEEEEEEIVEPQIEEMFETVQKDDEVKEDKKEEAQEKMETEETNEPASNEQENIEPEAKQDTPKKKSIIKNKQNKKQKKKRVENKLENKIENKEEQKPEPEKMEVDQANLTSTVSSTPDNSMPIPIAESTKKADPKKQNWSYEEVANVMKYLPEFDWLEEKAPGHKFLLSKLLAPPVFWFLVCSEYFPRRDFAGRDAKQLIQETIDKVHSVMPNFTQRLLKENIIPESIQSSSSTDTDESFLADLSKRIKDFVNQNDYERDLENISSNTALTPLQKNSYTEEDDQWLLEMRHYILDSFKKLEQENDQPKLDDESLPNFDVLTKIELDDLIALYEKDLSGLAHENFRNQTELENKMTQIPDGAKKVNNLRFDSNDMLADITISFPDEEEELLSLMERKQNDVKAVSSEKPKQTGSKTLQKSRGETAPEDIVCQVCNDGDFTDNDLIVFCAKCNVAVHQKCYGIVVLPEDDWICDLCINFGPSGKYLRCPLCDKRGGAMKPSSTKVDTELFVYTNPSYHSFLRSYAKFGSYRGVDHKPLSFKDLKRKSGHSKMLKQNKEEENLDELDYNFHELAEATFTPEELKDEPKPFNVWVHLTCIKFIPELFFGDRIHVTNILGFDKVGKERYKSECEVCKKKNNGATITCRKEFCTRGFHPECARRAGYYLDMKENSTNQMQCHIYCNKHTPLQLKRTLETKEKKKKDDIVKFFKQVEKSYFAHFNDIDRYGQGPVAEALNFEEEKAPIKKNKSINETGGGDTGAKRREEGYFMKLVENQRKKTSRTACIISLETEGEVPEDQTPPYKIIEIKQPLDKDRELKLGDVVWEAFSYKGLSPKQKYTKYKEIVKRKAAEAALNEHIEQTEKEKTKEQEKEAEEPVLSQQESKDSEDKMEEIQVTTEKIVEEPVEVAEKPVTPVIQSEKEQQMAEIEKPVEPEVSPVKEQKVEERPKFIIKLMKTSFLANFMSKDGPKLPFSPDYLTGSLLIDDMIPHKEDTICVCQKPYRGEIILGCAHCKDIFHPGCVEQSPAINSANWACKTCENSRMQAEEDGLADTEYSESRTSLVGKRPNSNSGSEEEPNPRKKINFGLNGLGYY